MPRFSLNRLRWRCTGTGRCMDYNMNTSSNRPERAYTDMVAGIPHGKPAQDGCTQQGQNPDKRICRTAHKCMAGMSPPRLQLVAATESRLPPRLFPTDRYHGGMRLAENCCPQKQPVAAPGRLYCRTETNYFFPREKKCVNLHPHDRDANKGY